MVKLHYNWKYLFLHPTMSKIIERYNLKFQHFTGQGGAC